MNKVAMDRLKLQVALTSAPRPVTNPNSEWMIHYMVWFFQTRLDALNEISKTDELP